MPAMVMFLLAEAIPADISPILCIIALGLLIINKSIKWRIPVFYIATAAIITILFGLINILKYHI